MKQPKDIFPKREHLVVKNEEGKEFQWDFLTLYDEAGQIIIRSKQGTIIDTLTVEYNNLLFVCMPNSDVFVTFDSLKEAINKI